MTLLRRRSVFAAKTETTVGTEIALTGADGVYNARDFMIEPGIGMTRREGQGGFNYLKSIPEGMMGTCKIVHDLAYDGTNIPTWASVLLPACGWVDTGGLFSPVSQGPGGGGVKTLTIGHYFDGKMKKLTGAMGTWVVTCPTGKVAQIEFTFTGKYFENETDIALIAPTYPTDPPLRFADGGITWSAVAICTANVTIDAGNSVIMRECAEAGNRTGFKSAVITDRVPVITADPEAVLVATENRDSQWLAFTAAAMVVTLNTTSGAIVFTAAAAQIEDKKNGDRSGLITDDLKFLCTAGATADTELTINFT